MIGVRLDEDTLTATDKAAGAAKETRAEYLRRILVNDLTKNGFLKQDGIYEKDRNDQENAEAGETATTSQTASSSGNRHADD